MARKKMPPPRLLSPVPKVGSPSEKVIEWVIENNGPRTILSFSRGKDSVGSMLALRPHFEKVIPVHFTYVPGLQFVEESLDYYERFFDVKIHRYLYAQTIEMLNVGSYQTPSNMNVILAWDYPDCHAKHHIDMVREDEGLPDTTFYALGVRMNDSLKRRTMALKHSMVTASKGCYYPIWDWDKARLYEAIKKSGVQLPVDYKMFGRSWGGIGLRYMLPIKKHFPKDYEKILEWFPLIDIEIWRWEKYGAIVEEREKAERAARRAARKAENG